MTSLVDGHLRLSLACSPHCSTPESAGPPAGHNQAERSDQTSCKLNQARRWRPAACRVLVLQQEALPRDKQHRRCPQVPLPASLQLLSVMACAFAEGSSPGLAAAVPVVLLCGRTLAGSGHA